MDKAVILDVYGFLGFWLCKVMLDKGIEVEGVFSEGEVDTLIIGEKRLEIGRNANFSEVLFEDWQGNKSEEEDLLVVLPVYDYYFYSKADPFIFKKYRLKEMFADPSCNLNSCRFALLLPIQLIANPEHHRDLQEEAEGVIEALEAKKASSQILYLPTLFGPWQPDFFFFQQTIAGKKGNKRDSDWNDGEWREDAIYIEDAVLEIIRVSEEVHTSPYVLKSESGNGWVRCAEWLATEQISDVSTESKPKIEWDISVRTVLEHTPFDLGLRKQQLHFEEVLKGRY